MVGHAIQGLKAEAISKWGHQAPAVAPVREPGGVSAEVHFTTTEGITTIPTKVPTAEATPIPAELTQMDQFAFPSLSPQPNSRKMDRYW